MNVDTLAYLTLASGILGLSAAVLGFIVRRVSLVVLGIALAFCYALGMLALLQVAR